MGPPAQTRTLLNVGARILLVAGIAAVTAIQILRPALNHDMRYVLGALASTSAAGHSWTEVWAHRPLTMRGLTALLAWVSPGEFYVQETWIRFWSVGLAIGGAALLWWGLSNRFPRRVAAWTAVAVGAALAWAPGWDFAEPEWYATVLAVAAIGIALRRSWGPLVAGILLAFVIGLKLTTIATAAAAALAVFALDRRRGTLTAMLTVLAAGFLFAIVILIEPREWQWMWDMPALNPPLTLAGTLGVAEGLVNSLVVSPITVSGLVAIGLLLIRGGDARRIGGLLFVALVVLTLPFVWQQQNFLYHMAAVPVASAALVAAVAAHAPRTPIALPVTGVLGLLASVSLFRIDLRTRDANWWIADIVFGLVLATGLVLMLVEQRRGIKGPRPDTPTHRLVSLVLVAAACLAPLLVTVAPWTAYSFSLAHSRTTAGSNLQQALDGPERRAAFNAVLSPDQPVVYLSFAASYWMGNPTPCVYASPTFLQRAVGERAEEIADRMSFGENRDCLAMPVQAVVIERNWFDMDRVPLTVRQEVRRNYDCSQPLLDDPEWLICPTR